MANEVPYRPEHVAIARKLVRETASNGGLAPVDLDRFWADQEKARKDPFGRDIPQVPLGAILNWECVFDELGVAEDRRRYETDEEWRLWLNKEYNDRAERTVGRRLLDEKPKKRGPTYPAAKKLHDVFEAKRVWSGESWWLTESARNEGELAALLDRVDARDTREFILPDGWDEAKAALLPEGVTPSPYRGQRGPVTFAMSVYGVERLIFLILDNPDLAVRFRDTILRVMMEIADVLDEEAGETPETRRRGFSFCDDNCAMLSPDMYDLFGFPVLQAVFDKFCPGPDDTRFQHSDSAMAHLLPALGKLRLTGTNFGPTVELTQIRRHLPRAVINGQLAPFTYSRNEHEKIVLEFLRDLEMAGEERGLVFATAGSVNNGTRLTSMRLAMAAIQRCGRYDA